MKPSVNKMIKEMKAGKWLVLEVKDNLSAQIYAQLRLLSLNNRIQVLRDGDVVVEKLSDNTRIIVVVYDEIIKNIERDYPSFRNLFGPIINIK